MPRTAPWHVSQTFPSHNEGFHAQNGLLSRVNREEAGNGERMKTGHRRCVLFRRRNNLTSRLVFFFLKEWRGDTRAVAVSPIFVLLITFYPG